jgi:hypothetical protein
VANPIRVNCNSGYVVLDQQGTLGNPKHVWYHPMGIANLVSLHHVKCHFRLTMDMDISDTIFLHSKDGSRIPFTPSKKGLYKYELPPNQSIQGIWSFLSQVSNWSEAVLVDTVMDQSKFYTR